MYNSALSLVPGGAARALPRNTRIQAGNRHNRMDACWSCTLGYCFIVWVSLCSAVGTDQLTVASMSEWKTTTATVIAIQCKQYSRAVVGYNVGLQLIGAASTTSARVGVVITPSTASREVKALSKSLRKVRQGELELLVREGDDLVRLLGKWSADIVDVRAALMDDVLGNSELCRRITASQPHGYCIRHAFCLPRQEGECNKQCSPLPLRHPLVIQLSASLPPPLSTISPQTLPFLL